MGRAQEVDCAYEFQAIKDIAAAHNVTGAQVTLRWGLQHGCAVIPKSTNEGRMAANMDLFGFSLTEDEMKTITAMDKNRRFNDPGHWWEIANNTFWPLFD